MSCRAFDGLLDFAAFLFAALIIFGPIIGLFLSSIKEKKYWMTTIALILGFVACVWLLPSLITFLQKGLLME